jgi:hypothetical protein
MFRAVLHKKSFTLYFVLLAFLFVMSGCATQGNGRAGIRINEDGTMVDTRTSMMWQKVRSEHKFSSPAEAEAYAAGLDLAGYTDWRLPTSQELWDLFYANDYTMKGELADQIELEGSYWTKDGDRVLAGYLEDGDDPGINRYFFDSKKGYVRAVRSLK